MALLSMDSKFMKFMDRFVDLALLNLLWLVFSLPLVTAGAATTAASALILRELDGESEPLVRAFWRQFRQNFVRGTVVWLLNAAALFALFLDGRLLAAHEDPPLVLLIVSIVSFLFVGMAFLYAYPLTARYDSPAFRTLQNSVQLCFRFGGRTLLLLLLLVLELALFSWNSTLLFFGLIIGPMVLLTTVASVARGMFRQLETL